jgi:hypothetical protein
MSAWLPPASGGSSRTETDEENLPVLTLKGFIRRAISPVEDYRITISIDIYQATAAEIHFAIPIKGAEKERRSVLRITREEGAVFGNRNGDKGAFHPESSPIPFPATRRDESRRPYLEVIVERAGGRWVAKLQGKEVGQASDDGNPKLPEFRVGTEGGEIRIETVTFEKLKEG